MSQERAKWRVTRPSDVSDKLHEDGTMEVTVGLRDDERGGQLVGHLRFTMTEDRRLTVFWEYEPDRGGPLTEFRAWSKEGEV